MEQLASLINLHWLEEGLPWGAPSLSCTHPPPQFDSTQEMAKSEENSMQSFSSDATYANAKSWEVWRLEMLRKGSITAPKFMD